MKSEPASFCFSYAENGEKVEKISPEFQATKKQIDAFFQAVEDNADAVEDPETRGEDSPEDELFWSSDVSNDGGRIYIEWFDPPKDPQAIVDTLNKMGKFNVAPFSKWSDRR